ncbi:T9SS type B sorting domain-containing protein [Chitinophaga rhizophila]|uniref:Gliding motility-associated C-terminal domain-containing protein n=1 Tax=Chitinophaga rhizophila TaxID=2866212 RepID=A0ABS7GAB7_9BACT|nr:gliding motility-associated C-terminal domain-containing protein [Chitinophaga rhizophila]MBW8683672.1 gliding motility-associated C-terminal domain-containing protein [Chitinophaga rhizophila]
MRNSSLEGTPGVKVAPGGWTVAANTPDVLPGVMGIYKIANAGNTFVGLQGGPVYREGIEQELPAPLIADRTYTMSFDLAYNEMYGHKHCYGNLAIFGGSSPKDTAELLWTSGSFTDTSWHRWNAIFTPKKTHTYISFYAYPSENCPVSSYGVLVFIDNLSTIKQILRTQLTATSSCKTTGTGTVQVKVNGGAEPYTYLWTPGNYTTPEVSGLTAGTYAVTVTAANGVTAKGAVTVEESDLHAAQQVTISDCAGDNKNAISLNITGGLPPYDLSLNGKETEERDFRQLTPGNYVFVLKDKQVCADTFNIFIKEPKPLQIRQVATTPCSCSEVTDGSIRWEVDGGTRPYKYRVNEYAWQPDSIQANLKAGNYQYEVADANGCVDGGHTSITSPNQYCFVMMPSAFSPNGDGNNDLFRPRVYDAITDYRLSVYNRWGSLVFQTNDPKTGWDGYSHGVPQTPQAFIYVCTFTTSKSEPKSYTGSVVLVK